VPNAKSVAAFFLKIGFWNWVAVSIVFNVVVGGIAWKIVAALFDSVQFAGFFSSFVAAAIVAAIVGIPTFLLNPGRYSESSFRKSVAEVAEKEDKNEQN